MRFWRWLFGNKIPIAQVNLNPYWFIVVWWRLIRALTKLNQGLRPVNQSIFFNRNVSLDETCDGGGVCARCVRCTPLSSQLGTYRQSRPDSGLGFEVKVLETCKIILSSHTSQSRPCSGLGFQVNAPRNHEERRWLFEEPTQSRIPPSTLV